MSAPLSSNLVRGTLLVVNVPPPAVNTDFLYTLPDQFYYELLYYSFRLICDANVASRYVMVQIGAPGGIAMFTIPPPVAQTASQTRFYWGSQRGAFDTFVYPNALQHIIPTQNVLGPSWEIGSLVDTMQATDQLTDIYIALLRHAIP